MSHNALIMGPEGRAVLDTETFTLNKERLSQRAEIPKNQLKITTK